MNHSLLLALAAFAPFAARAQHTAGHQPDSTGIAEQHLQAATVTASTRARHTSGAVNSTMLGQQEMFRAACCNLGESFVTNPSVDVAYDDAATGASQIKLLGLSGLYVQMLTETLPAFRGAAQPFALGYVPGTWMKSINVSKGAASVKNGFESVTGQIDIDYLKPDAERQAHVNLYTDTDLAAEVNADANVHINDRLSTNLLLHWQDQFRCHDENHDGFRDMPRVRQYNVMNRWKYAAPRYIMHAGLQALSERRMGGQEQSAATAAGLPRYAIGIATERYEAYMKHAFIVDPARGGNIALMANASWHHLRADYGAAEALLKHYDVGQTTLNAQLMYETRFTDRHALSTGLSLQYDHLPQHAYTTSGSNRQQCGIAGFSGPAGSTDERECVPGAYAQYTYTLGRRLTVMTGLRADYSNLYDGLFLTPRLHVKWSPADYVTLRAASGLGYRSPRALAENHNLLASGRTLEVRPAANAQRLDQETAVNAGIAAAFSIPAGPRLLRLNAEYYYTYFLQQTIVDYEHTSGHIVIHDLRDNAISYAASGLQLPTSFSHVVQVDAQYEAFPGFDITAAYRHNIVRCTYGNTAGGHYALREKILTPRFKALLSLCYQTPLKLWQFDVTLSVNGSGRLPDETPAGISADGTSASRGPATTYTTGGSTYFRPFEQLSAQVTRRFRHADVYLGGENLTDRTQPCPILGSDSPFATTFEPTLVYAPVDGWMLYAGVRFKF